MDFAKFTRILQYIVKYECYRCRGLLYKKTKNIHYKRLKKSLDANEFKLKSNQIPWIDKNVGFNQRLKSLDDSEVIKIQLTGKYN